MACVGRGEDEQMYVASLRMPDQFIGAFAGHLHGTVWAEAKQAEPGSDDDNLRRAIRYK